ncbi:MAG: heme-binding protein [Mycetocola sp.]
MSASATATDEELLAEVRAEASTLALPSFTHADARSIGEAGMWHLERHGLGAAIRVVRGTQIVYQASFAGTTAEHDDWMRRKANAVAMHGVSTLELALRFRLSGHTPDWLDPREIAVASGAVPLFVADNLVGIVAVTGLVDTMRADHDVAMTAVRSHRS